jgi:hypothetical protein
MYIGLLCRGIERARANIDRQSERERERDVHI